MAPPFGMLSNFSGPNPLQSMVIAVLAASLFISTTFTLLKVYAQHRLFATFTWSDLCIILAWASHVAFSSLLLAALPLGAGHHQWDVPLTTYYHIEFVLYIDFIVYGPAVVFAKAAILMQLNNIFTGTYKGVIRRCMQILIYANVIFYLSVTVAVIFECSPRERAWNPTVPGHCVNQNALLTSTGPANLISDFLIFFLPAWAVWHLQMTVHKKLGTCATFAIGLFGCSCSAVRLSYNAQLDRSGDGTYIIMQNQMWANAEITIAIVIADIIILPRFFKTVMTNPNRGTNPNRVSRTAQRPRVSRFTESFEMDDLVQSPPRASASATATMHDIDAINRAEQGVDVTSSFGVKSEPKHVPVPMYSKIVKHPTF
ncbi:hypothetical protein MMC30_006779 [Trapelia coarctata]|nr:hypothetical protein [Trapelia coarctata]